jgi:hypothetical protein
MGVLSRARALLLTCAFVVSVAATASAQPAVVQAASDPPAVGASITITFPGALTPGGVLAVCTNYGQFGGARTVAAPNGSWTRERTVTQTFNSIDLWWCPTSTCTGTTHVFTVSEGSEFASGVGVEVSGVDTTDPFDGSASSGSGSTSSLALSALTPTVIGTLPASCVTQDNSGAGGTSLSAGWTEVVDAVSAGGRGGVWSDNDTITTITGTWTIGSGPTEAVSIHMLFQPGGAPPPAAAPKLPLLGVGGW